MYPDTMLFVDDELLPASVGARAIGRRAASARLTAFASTATRSRSGRARRARGARADTSTLSAGGGHAPRTRAVVRARAGGQHGQTSGEQGDQQKTSCLKVFQGFLSAGPFLSIVTVRRAAATPSCIATGFFVARNDLRPCRTGHF